MEGKKMDQLVSVSRYFTEDELVKSAGESNDTATQLLLLESYVEAPAENFGDNVDCVSAHPGHITHFNTTNEPDNAISGDLNNASTDNHDNIMEVKPDVEFLEMKINNHKVDVDVTAIKYFPEHMNLSSKTKDSGNPMISIENRKNPREHANQRKAKVRKRQRNKCLDFANIDSLVNDSGKCYELNEFKGEIANEVSKRNEEFTDTDSEMYNDLTVQYGQIIELDETELQEIHSSMLTVKEETMGSLLLAHEYECDAQNEYIPASEASNKFKSLEQQIKQAGIFQDERCTKPQASMEQLMSMNQMRPFKRRRTIPKQNNSAYHCKLCDFSSAVEGILREHISSSHQRQPGQHQCKQCGFQTKYKDSLEKHIKGAHLNQFDYQCGQCEYKATQSHNLKMHMERTHLNTHDYQCSQCDYVTVYKNSLEKHIKGVHLKQYDFHCEECDYKTVKSHNLILHKRRHHQKLNEFKCSQCDYESRYKDSLEMHIKGVHLNQFDYRCNQCEYKTVKSYNLKLHFKRHHQSQLDFKCNQCDYVTNIKGSLKMHIKGKHLKEFDFQCSQCEYKTVKSYNLTLHTKRHHQRQFVFHCNKCNYKTVDIESLRKHSEKNHLKKAVSKLESIEESSDDPLDLKNYAINEFEGINESNTFSTLITSDKDVTDKPKQESGPVHTNQVRRLPKTTSSSFPISMMIHEYDMMAENTSEPHLENLKDDDCTSGGGPGQNDLFSTTKNTGLKTSLGSASPKRIKPEYEMIDTSTNGSDSSHGMDSLISAEIKVEHETIDIITNEPYIDKACSIGIKPEHGVVDMNMNGTYMAGDTWTTTNQSS